MSNLLRVKLNRADGQLAWGFRLSGGAEYNTSTIVTFVNDESPASEAGLQIHDVIITVGDIDVTTYTHADVHDLITSFEHELKLGVQRIDDDYCESDTDITLCKQEPAELMTTSPLPITEKPESDETIYIRNFVKEKRNQISTFLQKPNRELPRNLFDPQPVNTYKVVIRKQKKAVHFPNVEPVVSSTDDVNHLEDPELSDACLTAASDRQSLSTECTTQENEREADTDNDFTDVSAAECLEDDDDDDDENRNGGNDSYYEERESAVSTAEPAGDQLDCMTVEQKLLELHKQLDVLPLIPATVQETLTNLVQQLNDLIKSQSQLESAQYEADNDNSETSTDPGGVHTEDEFTGEIQLLADISEQDEDSMSQFSHSERNELIEEGQGTPTNSEDNEPESASQQQDIIVEESESENQDQLSKHEKECHSINSELDNKFGKLSYVDRPIILPGGRRLRAPDEPYTVPSHHNRLSDEKIASMIECHSEVIVGRTKGINFLRYQPPAKSLKHLNNSDVYKLVHDLQPPARGICSRTGQIMAAEDYYGTA